MEEDVDVLQRVGRGTTDVWNLPSSAQGADYPSFVHLTMNPCQMPQTCGGQGADLVVVVLKQLKMQILQLFAVSCVVQRGADHGIQRDH